MKADVSDLRVTLVSEEFPPFMFGGIASVCYDLSYSLSKKKVSTRVLTGRADRVEVNKVNDFLEIIRLPCLDVPPRFIWFQLQNYRSISGFIRESTIVHIVNPQTSAICVLLKKKLGKPLLSSIHGTPLSELKTFMRSPFSEWTIGDFAFNVFEYPLNDLAIRTCLMSSNRIVTCSVSSLQEIFAEYSGVPREKVSVINNGINMAKMDGISEEEKRIDGNGISIIYFGRLYWRKGVTYLVRAMDHLARHMPDVVMNIFGRGPMENEIRRLISSLDLDDKVFLKGHVPYASLINQIRKADIVVLPSLYEAQPVSVLEAMACKKPVVAFDLGFMREIIQNGHNGLLAKSQDAEDLSEKMGMLAQDTRLRDKLGTNAYDYVCLNHNWDVIVDKYIEQYRTILESC